MLKIEAKPFVKPIVTKLLFISSMGLILLTASSFVKADTVNSSSTTKSVSSENANSTSITTSTTTNTITSNTAIGKLSKMGQKQQSSSVTGNNHSLMKATATSPDTFYIGDNARPKIMAVDVSSYQSGLTQANYTKMASLGVKSVVVKATEGSSYTNPYALTQMKYAAKAGLNVALYQYATYSSTTEAKTEANYLLSWLKNNNVNSHILILSDIEDSAVTVSSVGTNMQAFQNTLTSGGYSNQGFYTSAAYTYLSKLVAIDGKTRGWIAQYPYTPSASSLLNSTYGAWQFSATAMLSGYSGYLDVSYDYTGLLSAGAGTDPFGTSSNSNSSDTTSSYTFKKVSGQTYAFLNGKKVTGWVAVGTRKYYFRSGDGVMLRNWQTINGKTYFFRTNDGVMLRNWQTINGKTYYFYSDGKMLRNWQTIDGKRYYFYKDGKLLRGYQTIDGVVYHLDEKNGQLLS